MSSPASFPAASSRRPDLPPDERGVVRFHPAAAFDLVYSGLRLDHLHFVGMDEAMAEHDRWCDAFDKPRAGRPEPTDAPDVERRRRTARWNIPEPYASIDIRAMLHALCRDDADRARVEEELALFEARGLIPVLRAALYVAESVRASGAILGVGRGSSVASHCLFLLGIHRVDSLRHKLDIREFLR